MQILKQNLSWSVCKQSSSSRSLRFSESASFPFLSSSGYSVVNILSEEKRESWNHHPISEEKILWRVLSSNWSMDITLLCRVNRRGTCHLTCWSWFENLSPHSFPSQVATLPWSRGHQRALTGRCFVRMIRIIIFLAVQNSPRAW